MTKAKPGPSLRKPFLTGMGVMRRALIGTMFLLVLLLGVRVVDMAQQLAMGRTPPGIAPAVAESAPAPDAAKTPASADAAKGMPAVETPKMDAPPAAADAGKDAAAPVAEAPAPPPMEEPENYSEAEVAILRKLSDRRQELDKRGREIDQREALMKVAEQRVDKKIADLNALKDEIRRIVGDATETQKAQAASLVKIYETMKPKDAARIFENLDMPVLIEVVRRMKESKVAPIMGEMDPMKAKELTSSLMEKKELPPLPQ